MNVTSEADKYMVQKILEQLPEIVENPEILARFDDKSQAFLKESYAKDIKFEKELDTENSQVWKKAAEEAERSKNPIKSFSNKVKSGILNFFKKAGYIEEYDEKKEEPVKKIENSIENETKKEEEVDNSNEGTKEKNDEEIERERERQKEKLIEQTKKVKERAEKDLEEFERIKENTDTRSDFDYSMREVLINMLDESIKMKMFERKRIDPKFFGTDEEYANEYDFFVKEEAGEFADLKERIVGEKELLTDNEKAEALKLITRNASEEYINAMFPSEDPTEEELIAARDALKDSNMAYLDIRLEKLGFVTRSDGTVRFNGSKQDILQSAPFVRQLEKYDRDFSTLEVSFKNTREDVERFDEIISLFGTKDKKIVLAKEGNDFITKFSEIRTDKKGIIVKGTGEKSIDAIMSDPIDAKEFLYELKEIRDVTLHKNKALGYSEPGEKPRLSIHNGTMFFKGDYEPRKLIKQLEVLSESYTALNLPNERLKSKSNKYKPEKYNIKILPNDTNGPKWEFNITADRSIEMTGDSKVCEMISSRLLRGDEFLNIKVNGKVIKEEMKEKTAVSEKENNPEKKETKNSQKAENKKIVQEENQQVTEPEISEIPPESVPQGFDEDYFGNMYADTYAENNMEIPNELMDEITRSFVEESGGRVIPREEWEENSFLEEFENNMPPSTQKKKKEDEIFEEKTEKNINKNTDNFEKNNEMPVSGDMPQKSPSQVEFEKIKRLSKKEKYNTPEGLKEIRKMLEEFSDRNPKHWKDRAENMIKETFEKEEMLKTESKAENKNQNVR